MMFDAQIIADAKKHAVQSFPDESCGLVAGGQYIPCANVHDEPQKHFKIDPHVFLHLQQENGKIEALVHSHPRGGPDYPTKVDMQTQQDMAIPWGIIVMLNGHVKDPFWFGDQVPIPPLVGREFRSGVTDCYAVVRDWYRLNTDILLPDYPRDPEWWTDGPSMPDMFFDAAGFREIPLNVKTMQPGDLILARIASKVTNHTAIYLGNGLLLHHIAGRLSNREPLGPRLHRVVRVGRHVRAVTSNE
jgi:proteasome lid subunit RPN8/RPN11